MDIHKPKAAHSWREFLIEIGTIVCGILIALVLDEAVRTLRDRETAEAATESVRAELRENLGFMKARLLTQPCVEKRLDEIGDVLERSGEGPLVRPIHWVGQPPTWFLIDQRWLAATASGRASLLSAKAQGDLGGLYVFMNRFNDSERNEQAAWAQLRGLESWQGPLGSAGRVHFLQALQQARFEIWQHRITTGIAQARADELDLKGIEPKTMLRGYKAPHAVCLPMDTPREKALKILATDGSPPWGQPK